MRTIIFAVALLLGAHTTASPDSDGSFCVGRGYLAYETRSFDGSSEHLLHVIQYSRARGISRLPPIALEEFQVHAMSCRPAAVELHGWTLTYVVDISDPLQPAVAAGPLASEAVRSLPTGNLSHWSQEQIIDLEADDAAPGEFQLVISRSSRRVPGGMEHFTVSVLIQRDPALGPPRVLQSSQLFVGVFRETAD